MSTNQQQTLANHTRLHPPFHFVLVPLLLVFLIQAFIQLFRRPNQLTASLAILSIAVLLTAFLARIYALKVQDRVIRLEEEVRMARLLPDDLLKRISQLTIGQFVALRFASDAELASLVQQALDESLTSRQIKQKVVNWRPDFHRV